MNTKHTSAREILRAYKRYVVESITLMPTDVKKPKLNEDQALDQLLALLECELIGEDEKETPNPLGTLPQVYARNGLRAEQRHRLKKLMGNTGEE